MSSSITTELKTFRDSLSHSFSLFSLGLDVRNPERLSEAFNVLLDHELQSFEQRLSDREHIHSMSVWGLEKTEPALAAGEEEKEVVVQPPTLVIHPEPSVIVTKYEAPKMAANVITSSSMSPPPMPPPSPTPDEEVEADELEEEEPVEEQEEVEDEEDLEVVQIGKKKYHVGVTSRTVYMYIDEESAGEVLGTLKNGKIVA